MLTTGFDDSLDRRPGALALRDRELAVVRDQEALDLGGIFADSGVAIGRSLSIVLPGRRQRIPAVKDDTVDCATSPFARIARSGFPPMLRRLKDPFQTLLVVAVAVSVAS
jgi:hypothetical protein